MNRFRSQAFFVGAAGILLFLLPDTARADFSKTISVIQGQQVNAVTTWYYANCTTVLAVGSYSVNVVPKHGALAFGELSGPIPGCPTGSPSLPAAVAYYTWTDTITGDYSDYFQLTFSANGASEIIDISVVLGQPIIPPPPPIPNPACDAPVVVTPGAAIPPSTIPLLIADNYAQSIPAIMNASLTAPGGLNALATTCGFAGFDWVQQITYYPAPSAIYAASDPGTPIMIPPQSPIHDPPSGGYTYAQSQAPPYLGAYPFVYNPASLSECLTQFNGTCYLHITEGNTLNFKDTPANPCLNPDYLQLYNGCEGSPVPPALKYMAFTTQLVGICPATNFTNRSSLCASVDMGNPSAPLYEWTWISTFDGTTGGVSVTASSSIPDPGSGTGGATITSINGVALPPAVPPSQIATTASGLAYSRASKTFNGTLTITNISNTAINGPVQIFFMGMPFGVTLANATNNLSGTPYLTVPGVATIAPGQSITVDVQFNNPSNANINFTPTIYSGSIN